ncbi:glycosyltransferase family 2 protein [candidate division KSB1 bacterium]
MTDRHTATLAAAVVIPALNASRTLPPLVDSILDRYPSLSVIVVDDGSTDGTGDSVGKHDRIVVLRHPVNLGKGMALRTAFDYARDRGLELLVTMDADGQHDIESIGLFLKSHRLGPILIGDRMGAAHGMPWLRRLTNWTTSLFVSLLAGKKIRDSQSGFRLIHVSALGRLKLTTSRYDTESEILIQAGRLGLAIGHLPVPTIYADGQSFIQPFRDTGLFLRLALRTIFM